MPKVSQLIPHSIKMPYYKLRELKNSIVLELQTRSAQINPEPIFVLGNQKSGTSAIAALLGEMTGLSVAIDLKKEIFNPTYHQIIKGELTFSKFVESHKLDFSRCIVKEPNLTLLEQNLSEYFPNSQLVFVIRDPRDNIRSILNRLQLPGNLSKLEAEDWEKINQSWKLIVDNSWLGLSGENYIEMLAARWNFTSNVFLKNEQKMKLIRYEDFLKDKKGEITRLAKGLKLNPSKDISDKVDIQFQGRGNREVKWQEFFGPDNLSRIEVICGEKMKLLSYPSIGYD
jgi:hypothetical protein